MSIRRNEDASFKPLSQPQTWDGRYNRIAGESPVFHVKLDGGTWRTVIYWERGSTTGTCYAVQTQAERNLVEAVNEVKSRETHQNGGSFQINAYGRVIVPVANSYQKYVVGHLRGNLEFENPFQPGETFDLGDRPRLSRGSRWKRPYVGMPYKLSENDNIYFVETTDSGDSLVYLDYNYSSLINDLRNVCRWGSVTFIINPTGLILTKKEINDDHVPHYVGKLDKDKWFDKEPIYD